MTTTVEQVQDLARYHFEFTPTPELADKLGMALITQDVIAPSWRKARDWFLDTVEMFLELEPKEGHTCALYADEDLWVWDADATNWGVLTWRDVNLSR